METSHILIHIGELLCLVSIVLILWQIRKKVK